MEPKFYLLKTESKIKRIDLNDLLYVSVNDNVVTFCLTDKKVIGYSSLKAIEKELPFYFIKINRGLLINGNRIAELDIKNRVVILDNQERHPVAIRRIIVLKKALTEINYALTG